MRHGKPTLENKRPLSTKICILPPGAVVHIPSRINLMELWSPHLTAPQRVGVLPYHLALSCLQPFYRLGPCHLNIVPCGRGEVVVTAIVNDKGITAVGVLQGIGEICGGNEAPEGEKQTEEVHCWQRYWEFDTEVRTLYQLFRVL